MFAILLAFAQKTQFNGTALAATLRIRRKANVATLKPSGTGGVAEDGLIVRLGQTQHKASIMLANRNEITRILTRLFRHSVHLEHGLCS